MTVEAPNRVSEELFDEFHSSIWPEHFGAQASYTNINNVEEDQALAYLEHYVTIAPQNERDMLEVLGVIEQEALRSDSSNPRRLKFTDLGKEIVAACADLFTADEYEMRAKDIREIHKARGRAFEDKFGFLALVDLVNRQ